MALIADDGVRKSSQTVVTSTKPASGTSGMYTPPKYIAPKVTTPPPAPSTTTRTGTSSTYQPPPAPPAAPPAPPPAAGGAAGDSATPGADDTAAMLEAALAAIEAQYGLTAEQLMMDESEVGRNYRLLLAESLRIGKQQSQQVQAGALDRGILQSGIYADEQAKLAQALAEQRAQYEQQKAAEVARIAAERAALPAQEAAARAAAAQEAAQAGLDLDLIKAAANGGV